MGTLDDAIEVTGTTASHVEDGRGTMGLRRDAFHVFVEEEHWSFAHVVRIAASPSSRHELAVGGRGRQRGWVRLAGFGGCGGRLRGQQSVRGEPMKMSMRQWVVDMKRVKDN